MWKTQHHCGKLCGKLNHVGDDYVVVGTGENVKFCLHEPTIM